MSVHRYPEISPAYEGAHTATATGAALMVLVGLAAAVAGGYLLAQVALFSPPSDIRLQTGWLDTP